MFCESAVADPFGAPLAPLAPDDFQRPVLALHLFVDPVPIGSDLFLSHRFVMVVKYRSPLMIIEQGQLGPESATLRQDLPESFDAVVRNANHPADCSAGLAFVVKMKASDLSLQMN